MFWVGYFFFLNPSSYNPGQKTKSQMWQLFKKKKRCILLIPYVYRLLSFWEVHRALQISPIPICYLHLKKRLENAWSQGVCKTSDETWVLLFCTLSLVSPLLLRTSMTTQRPFTELCFKPPTPFIVPTCHFAVTLRQKPEHADSSHQTYWQTQLLVGCFLHQAVCKVTSAWCTHPQTNKVIPGP